VNPLDIRSLDHVVLRVTDLVASLHFYADVLGCREERRLEDLGLYQLRAGSSLIDLVVVDSPLGKLGGDAPHEQGRNLDHFALQLGAFDEDAIRAHLVRHAVEPGDVAERYGAGGNGPSMYIRDPDGNLVELKGPPSGT
jgi:catechol 2,3-dioxygenase-like lactoylglutathione lyase family enzyme